MMLVSCLLPYKKCALINLRFDENITVGDTTFLQNLLDIKDFVSYLSKKGARDLPILVGSRDNMKEKLKEIGYNDTPLMIL